MSGFLSQIVFMQPIILTALLALPLIWYLLRVTPPAPKTVIFPPARFLVGLVAEQNSPSKSPWWILLLRLLMLALIITALARPVINPADSLAGNGAVRLVIDNSWPSAQSWNMQVSAAEEAIAQAGRESREIYIITTTPAIAQDIPAQHGPISQSEASSILRALSPNPWPANYNAFIQSIKDNRPSKAIHSLWFSHGLDEGGINYALTELQNQGGVSYISPTLAKLPLLLRPSASSINKKKQQSDIKIDIDAPPTIIGNIPVSVSVMAQKGDIIDIQSTILRPDKTPKTLYFDVIEALKNNITKFKISRRSGAGAVFLLDDQFKKRKVGIAAPAQKELSAPLIEASYYIRRALEPYADITTAEINALISSDMSVIILADLAAMPTETLNNLENWVEDGGLLLRFSGENMAKAQGEQFLLPVALRAGGRSLSGALSWDEKQNIAPFPENSPFYGLNIPDDITINQYVLADPAQDLENKIWARLTDGTPFITASAKGNGLITLIHTSANTSWSDFALSGLYVSVLKRIIRLAGLGNISSISSYSSLDPLLVMDGMGSLISPPAAVAPIPAGSLDNIVPSSIHPPGLYGHGKMQYALNIGTNLPPLKATSKLPSSIKHSYYEADYELDIMPFILYGALSLFALDWLIMIFIAGNGMRIIGRYGIIIILATISSPSLASDEQFAQGLYLAYIQTGDASIDTLSQNGLEALSNTLTRRTSVEPVGVIGLNPEIDDMAFFPLIYWPISDTGKTYSSKALSNIQYYLDHGGTILFDTRDQNRSTGSILNTPNAKALRRITASLNIPPIAPIPADHVLGRSFYLLDEYPGQYSAGTLWVEQQSASGRDNVSSVIIGSNDWAGSWALSTQKARHRYGSTSSKQHEMAMRFGVNLVMYALTGNYKADQVHIPHILKRLGK